MPLSLREAVARALEANPALAARRMDRMLDRYDREDAERHFAPQWEIGRGVGTYRHDQATGARSLTLEAGLGVTLRLPSGGTFEAGPGWRGTIGNAAGGRQSTGVRATIRQSLGRGAGRAIAGLPVTEAALRERGRVEALRQAVSEVVTQVAQAYQAVIQAELQGRIEHDALAQARAAREVVEALIGAGRVARSERTLSDAGVAEREIGVVRSEEAQSAARTALAELLGLEAGVRIVTTEPLEVRPEAPDGGASLARALEHDPGYRQARIALEQAAFARRRADDATRWDVALSAEAAYDGDGPDDLAGRVASHGSYTVRLDVAIPFGGGEDRKSERAALAARIRHLKAARAVETTRRELDIAVERGVATVRSRIRGMRLARESLALAQRTEAIEAGRPRRGLTSSYRMGQIRSDLARAATAELNARIDYLDAVAALRRIEGTTLERWGIMIDRDTGAGSMTAAAPHREWPAAGEGGAKHSTGTGTETETGTGITRSPDTTLMLRLDTASTWRKPSPGQTGGTRARGDERETRQRWRRGTAMSVGKGGEPRDGRRPMRPGWAHAQGQRRKDGAGGPGPDRLRGDARAKRSPSAPPAGTRPTPTTTRRRWRTSVARSGSGHTSAPSPCDNGATMSGRSLPRGA